jgi:CTP-dependent riboflavin kinase
MIILRGSVCPEAEGAKHFSRRMTQYPEVFERATGERLYPGTLNVNVGRPIPVREYFRIRGTEIDEPEQDLLFEVCRINQIWAYRIRPFHLATGGGGHGDHIIELACFQKIPNVTPGTEVEIALFPRN